MPRLSTLGDAAMGVTAGVISVNGTAPAPVLGSITGDPRWLDDETLIFQVTDSSSLAVGLNTIDVNTLTTAFVRTEGENRLAAGGGNWAAFRSIDVGIVETSLGGSYSGAALGDMGEDGAFAIATSYVNNAGVTAYSETGTQQWSVPDALVFASPMPVREGLVAYCSSPDGWIIRRIAAPGRPAVYAARVDLPYQLIPVTVTGAFGGLWVVEASTVSGGNILTVRQADVARGYQVVTNAPTFNIDARQVSNGVIRIAWSTDAEESADALEMMDLTVATGANRTAVISGGAPVWTVNSNIAQSDLPTVPGTGTQPGRDFVSNLPPIKHPMIGADGRVTVPWGQYFQTLSQNMSTQIVASAVLPPVSTLPAYRSITSGAQTPIFANDLGRFNLFSDSITITLNQTEQEIVLETISSQSGQGNIPGLQGDDGDDGVMGPPGPAGAGASAADIEAAGYWSPLTNGDPVTPEIVFADGDTISIWTATP